MIIRYKTFILYISIAIFTLTVQSCILNKRAIQSDPIKSLSFDKRTNWQLFVDHHWIENLTNITFQYHQPEKLENNPIIQSEVPWEENPYCFGSVIYDEVDTIFKFWYQSYNFNESVAQRTPILYSTSSDGIHWFRPNLGLFEFNGSTNNNIVLQNYGYHDLYSPCVVRDHQETNPNKKYKMVWWDYPLGSESYQDDGMCVAFSHDGIHWTKYENNPVLHANKSVHSISDVMSVMYDTNIKKYVTYAKGWADPWPSFRQIVRTESEDFIHWTTPEVVITHRNTLEDPQSYGMTVTQFGNYYLGLLHSYKNPGNETIDLKLMVSHDNKKWNPVGNNHTFLPLGPLGSWDDGMIFSTPLFHHGNKTMLYYGGWDAPHDGKDNHSGIGLAFLRKNGFVSLKADYSPAVLLTKPMSGVEGHLFINVNAKGGSLRAAITDTAGNTVPGYSIEECISVHEDQLEQMVQWKKHDKLPTSIDTLRIKFEMTQTELYGFYAGENVKCVRSEQIK